MAFPTSAELTDLTTPKSEMINVFDDWLKACRQLPGASPVSLLYVSGGIITPTVALHRIRNEGDSSTDEITNIDISNFESGAELTLYKSASAMATTIVHAAGGDGQIMLLRNENRLLPATATLSAVKLTLIGSTWYELDYFYANLKSSSPNHLIGYAGGAGGYVVQTPSRTSTVAVNKPTAIITLYTAAGTSTPTTFRVSNSLVDTITPIVINQSGGTNKYAIHITKMDVGYFDVTFWSVSGTAVDTPEFTFVILQGQAS